MEAGNRHSVTIKTTKSSAFFALLFSGTFHKNERKNTASGEIDIVWLFVIIVLSGRKRHHLRRIIPNEMAQT